MKHTPLPLRILGGILIGILLLVGCMHPMLTRGECAALIGVSHMDKPYVFGTDGPESFDCSGLTKEASKYFDIDLIHSAKYIAYDDQYPKIEQISSLLPGDLVFFDTVDDNDRYDHVGIWLGMNRFVHASSTEMKVMISRFDAGWRAEHSGSRRIVAPYEFEAINKFFY